MICWKNTYPKLLENVIKGSDEDEEAKKMKIDSFVKNLVEKES